MGMGYLSLLRKIAEWSCLTLPMGQAKFHMNNCKVSRTNPTLSVYAQRD